jgi:hypothetical protein
MKEEPPMAVSVPNYTSSYPEFRGAVSSKSRVARTAVPVSRNARRSEVAAPRPQVRRRARKGRLFSSRLMDDLCAVGIVGGFFFFALSIARMLLAP